MTYADDIHRSITEKDDLEEIHEREIPVGEVLRSLWTHPLQIVTRWNWKAAVLGALLRASFYFTVYQAAKEHFAAAITAAGVEFGFRFFTSGISGALVQSFRRATPPWLAALIVTISLPIFSHTVEYATHYVQEIYFAGVLPPSSNNGRQYAFAFSVLFSAVSAIFNLFAMRHGVLLVGAGNETRSLWSDIRKFPALILEFLTFLPLLTLRFFQKKRYLLAAAVPVAFGMTIGTLLGIFRGKFSWGWVGALSAFAVMLVLTLLVALASRIMHWELPESSVLETPDTAERDGAAV